MNYDPRVCALPVLLMFCACSASSGSTPAAVGDQNDGPITSGGSATGQQSGTGSGSGQIVIDNGAGGNSGSTSGGGASGGCGVPAAVGLIRDFKPSSSGGHPDFEKQLDFVGHGVMRDGQNVGIFEPGIVAPTLGPDLKPVFSGDGLFSVSNAANFDQWYRDTPGVNLTIDFTLPFETDAATGQSYYDTAAFFPIDGQGFSDLQPDDDGLLHNFSFTFELHMRFVYRGGEIFRFRGDDDLFIFINNTLALDLGGVHAPLEGEVNLDQQAAQLGIQAGSEYAFDVFQAERHTTQSNFRVETTLKFTNCDPIVVR